MPDNDAEKLHHRLPDLEHENWHLKKLVNQYEDYFQAVEEMNKKLFRYFKWIMLFVMMHIVYDIWKIL